MSRLYRGKKIDGKGWIEGFLCKTDKAVYISASGLMEAGYNGGGYDCVNLGGFVPVHPDTVGQGTGLMSKNEKEIFGSIEINGQMTKGGDVICTNPKGYEYKREVRWNQDFGCWSTYNDDTPWHQLDGDEAESSGIIGIIHTEPEPTIPQENNDTSS